MIVGLPPGEDRRLDCMEVLRLVLGVLVDRVVRVVQNFTVGLDQVVRGRMALLGRMVFLSIVVLFPDRAVRELIVGYTVRKDIKMGSV